MTGERAAVSHSAEILVSRVRPVSKLPVAVCFGISSAAQVRETLSYADAAVVGSAIVAEIERLTEILICPVRSEPSIEDYSAPTMRRHPMSEANSNESTKVADRRKGIAAGTAVIVVLHSPKEKCWGVLSEIDAAGIYLRGLDLNAFDDWLRAIAYDEPTVGLSDLFFPMWRVERISKDESVGDAPSMADRFRQRTGRSIDEMMTD